MFVVLKTTTVAAEVKAEALWELLWPHLLRINTDVSTGQASPRFYVIQPTVRVQREVCTILYKENAKIHDRCEQEAPLVNEIIQEFDKTEYFNHTDLTILMDWHWMVLDSQVD